MATDPFGHTRLKPNKAGGESWVMNNSNFENDSRLYQSTGDGYHISNGFTISDDERFRAGISTSSGFNDGACTQNQATMVNRGYMQAPNDWKNTEFTGVFRIFNSSSDTISLKFRTGRHTGGGGPRGCTGSAYAVSVAMNGNRIRLRKESWHVSYHDCTDVRPSGWDSRDGPFGIKVLVYNSSNNQNVTIEVYLDKTNNNNWQRVINFTDSGQVNSDADECDCDDDGQPITWGAPLVSIRGDDGEYGFKDVTIYEIDPFGSGGGDDGGGPSSTGYAVTAVTASSDDGNVPSNTRDGNFGTRWSAYNQSGGQWIRYDLGSAKPVDEVKIAWHNGNTRTNEFNIHTSTDGNSWTQKINTTSSGNTTGFESYTFASTSARYVRITGHGNSSNEWVSITEVEIHGADSDPGSGGGGGGTPPPATEADFNILETIFALDYNSIGLCNPAGVE